MKSESDQHLSDLLTTFDATGLGEGDPVAGLNLLAAMAVSLANLSRPGSGIMTKEGRLVPAGCNLLASGSLVTSLVLDGVVTPVSRCQANLLAQLARLLEDDAAGGAKSTLRHGTRTTTGSPRTMTSSS
jgi:hypothetical protein